MRHVVPGTNPNEHIRTDSQIRAESFAGCVLKPPAKTSGRKVLKTFIFARRRCPFVFLSPCRYHQNLTQEDEKISREVRWGWNIGERGKRNWNSNVTCLPSLSVLITARSFPPTAAWNAVAEDTSGRAFGGGAYLIRPSAKLCHSLWGSTSSSIHSFKLNLIKAFIYRALIIIKMQHKVL